MDVWTYVWMTAVIVLFGYAIWSSWQMRKEIREYTRALDAFRELVARRRTGDE